MVGRWIRRTGIYVRPVGGLGMAGTRRGGSAGGNGGQRMQGWRAGVWVGLTWPGHMIIFIIISILSLTVYMTVRQTPWEVRGLTPPVRQTPGEVRRHLGETLRHSCPRHVGSEGAERRSEQSWKNWRRRYVRRIWRMVRRAFTRAGLMVCKGRGLVRIRARECKSGSGRREEWGRSYKRGARAGPAIGRVSREYRAHKRVNNWKGCVGVVVGLRRLAASRKKAKRCGMAEPKKGKVKGKVEGAVEEGRQTSRCSKVAMLVAGLAIGLGGIGAAEHGKKWKDVAGNDMAGNGSILSYLSSNEGVIERGAVASNRGLLRRETGRGYSGVRLGEAKNLGPYTEGGASGSVTAWEQVMASGRRVVVGMG